MSVEILPLGGLGEIGKNMTAIGFDDEYIVVDMGFRLDSILAFEDANIGSMSMEELIKINGIPDDTQMRGRKVRAIVLTHGHLDHIGAVGKLAREYGAPIYGTPFTIELTRNVLKEENFEIRNELIEVPPGQTIGLEDLEIEFIRAIHSIPQTVYVAIHGSEGTVLCASDFKLDGGPVLGETNDFSRLKSLAKEGILAALVGAVRVDEAGPTPPESRAREMLSETLEEAISAGGSVLVTTFSSHIARIKSIVELSLELGRTPIILGRSLRRNCMAAMNLGLVNFPKELRIHGRANAVRNSMREVEKSRKDNVLIVTGHQGEPTSVLSRIVDGHLPFRIQSGDEVIFSASVIPNPINQMNRELLEAKLDIRGAHVYKDVHVSGHAAKWDTGEFIKLAGPEHLVPCHGEFEKLKIVADLGRMLGYSNDQIHLLRNGQSVKLGG